MLLVAVALCAAAFPAFAAEIVYPANVEYTEGPTPTIRKIYYLSPEESPGDIPTADIERSGYLYTFADMLKQSSEQAETKRHSETVTLPCNTADMGEVLKLFDPSIEFITEEGFSGVLTLDHTTMQVEVDGYKNSSYNVTANRTYPNLSAADVSLVPKTVEENGRTLALDNVNWQEARTASVDGYDMPELYTATATYSGTANSRKATGYTATAEYAGELSKTVPGPVCYTAIFEGAEIAPPEPEPAPEPSPEAQTEPAQTPEPYTGISGYTIALVLLFLAGLALYGFLKVKKLLKKRRDNP